MQCRIIGRALSFLSHFLSFSIGKRKLYGGERGRGCARLRVRGAAGTRLAPAVAGRQRPEPICSRRRWRAEAGTLVLASPLAGGGVQRRTSPPAAGFAQWSPAADVGQPGAGL